MTEAEKERWRKKVDSELAELAKFGLRPDLTPEGIAVMIATKYMQGR